MTTRTPETPAARLHRLRQAAGLTQRQLAAASGVSQPVLARVERGARPLAGVSAGALVALAAALGTTAEALLDPTR